MYHQKTTRSTQARISDILQHNVEIHGVRLGHVGKPQSRCQPGPCPI